MKLEFLLYEAIGGRATSELIPQISVSLYGNFAKVMPRRWLCSPRYQEQNNKFIYTDTTL